LGKRVFAACDQQEPAAQAGIEAQVEHLFMHDQNGFENLVLQNTTQPAMTRFAGQIEWPPHLLAKYLPAANPDSAAALSDYFGWAKGNWGIADFLAQCSENEVPQWLRDACAKLKELCEPPAPPAPTPADIAAMIG
jgi:putative ATP-dependent endonuclease of OLD family